MTDRESRDDAGIGLMRLGEETLREIEDAERRGTPWGHLSDEERAQAAAEAAAQDEARAAASASSLRGALGAMPSVYEELAGIGGLAADPHRGHSIRTCPECRLALRSQLVKQIVRHGGIATAAQAVEAARALEAYILEPLADAPPADKG